MIKRILIGVILLLLVLLAGGGWFMLHTQAALHWALARVSAHYPGEFSVGRASGTLAGPVTLEDVQLRGTDFNARIGHLRLDWQPLLLLVRRASISQLSASDVQVNLTPPAQRAPFRFVRPRPPHLPLAISLSRVQIVGLTLTAPQLQAPLQVSQAAFMARLDNHNWTVRGFTAEGTDVSVQGNGLWAFRRGDQINAELDWRVALPGGPRLAGHAEVAGDDQLARFSANLSAPFRIEAHAQLHALFSAPHWQGELHYSDLDPARLRRNWPALNAQGTLTFDGDPSSTRVQGSTRVHEAATGDWLNRFQMRLAGDALEVQQLDVNRVGQGARFTLTGRIGFADQRIWPNLTGTWQQLALPLSGATWLSSPQGRLEIHGGGQALQLALAGQLESGGRFSGRGNVALAPPHAWQLTAEAQKFSLRVPALRNDQVLPPMNWQLSGHGDDAHSVLERFTADWLGGTWRAQGQFQHGGRGGWQLALAAKDVNSAPLFPEFPGLFSFNAQLSGARAPQTQWQLILQQAHGQLRDAPVSASGLLAHGRGGWRMQNLALRVGPNHASFAGNLGKTTDLDWDVAAPALELIWPEIHGSLASRGHADLSSPQPQLGFTLAGAQLAYQNYSLQNLSARVDMNGTGSDGSATLHADTLILPQGRVDRLQAKAHGSFAAHTLDLQMQSPAGQLTLAGSGAYQNGLWQGTFTHVTLAPTGAGEWRNAEPWPLRLAANEIHLGQGCVTQAEAQACVQAQWQTGVWQAGATLAAVPLSDLQALLPPGLEYDGRFGGTLNASGDTSGHELNLSATLTPGAVHNLINHRRVTLLAYTGGTAQLHADADQTEGSLNWQLKDGGYLNVDTHIEGGPQPALSGSIQGELHDFDLIPALIPEVASVQGRLNINLGLSGSPADPEFNGSAALSDGAILVPRFGLHIRDLRLNLKGNGNRLNLDGEAQSGNGRLAWQSSALRQAGVWHAQGQLSGANFRASDIPEAQVDVSPALTFKLDGRDLQLDGEVRIPHAKLRPRDLSHSAQVSPDQVIVGANGEPPAEKWRVHASVRTLMGEDVDFSGFGLSGRIAGSVLAVDEPGHFTTGSGELEIVDGHYAAYGQKLNIERGRLLFNGGAIANPALDIRAIRPPAHPETLVPGRSEQKVGVIVRGTLRDPKVSLFAIPPLPQSQLLSYLITGQTGVSQNPSPLIGAPPTTASDVTQIAGGQLLASELGQQIGVNDVSVQNVALVNGTSATAMFFGKYLSPRLYLSYGVGLGQAAVNIVRIRYTLSTRWMLEAESGNFVNSADLIYSIER